MVRGQPLCAVRTHPYPWGFKGLSRRAGSTSQVTVISEDPIGWTLLLLLTVVRTALHHSWSLGSNRISVFP